MPRGRLRAVLAAAVAVAVLAAGGAVVVERRRRVRAEDRLAQLARQREHSQRQRNGTEEPAGDGGGGGLLDRLLEALGGGGGALGGSFLQDCSAVLAGAGDAAGLFPGGAQRGGDAATQLREIAIAVEEVRDLRFRQVPEPVYLSPAQLDRRVQAEVAEDLGPGALAAETRALVALGALEPGSDLRALILRALGEQVAGFYVPESGELVVRRAGGTDELDSTTRMALAHELDHALTDQVLDLPVDDDRPVPGTEDAALAALALIEGDATLAMQLYALRHVALLEQLSGLGGALAAQEQLAELPHHVQRSLTFPYLQGLSFACRLHAEGGWRAVDRAYDDPPSTTAQVLFPERYLAREAAVDARDPSPPGAGWEAAPGQALGAAELLWLLEAPGGDPDAALDQPLERAAAWAGGELRSWTAGDRTALAVALVERADARPALCATITTWYAAAFPGGRSVPGEAGEELAVDGPRQDAVVRCSSAEVRLGIGPDLATARAVTR